jgi:hypothetical protein
MAFATAKSNGMFASFDLLPPRGDIGTLTAEGAACTPGLPGLTLIGPATANNDDDDVIVEWMRGAKKVLPKSIEGTFEGFFLIPEPTGEVVGCALLINSVKREFTKHKHPYPAVWGCAFEAEAAAAAVGLVIPLPPFASLPFSPRGVNPPPDEEEGEVALEAEGVVMLLVLVLPSLMLAGGSRSSFGRP